jgi:hypothetical protein
MRLPLFYDIEFLDNLRRGMYQRQPGVAVTVPSYREFTNPGTPVTSQEQHLHIKKKTPDYRLAKKDSRKITLINFKTALCVCEGFWDE